MAFWIFMFASDLLIPLCMIGFGGYFRSHSPKEINSLFGYRTSMSRKNNDTWEFAHHYFGRWWWLLGWIVLIPSVAVMIALIGKSTGTIGMAGGVLCFVQMIPMLFPIVLTEIALRRTFDKDGNRK